MVDRHWEYGGFEKALKTFKSAERFLLGLPETKFSRARQPVNPAPQ